MQFGMVWEKLYKNYVKNNNKIQKKNMLRNKGKII